MKGNTEMYSRSIGAVLIYRNTRETCGLISRSNGLDDRTEGARIVEKEN